MVITFIVNLVVRLTIKAQKEEKGKEDLQNLIKQKLFGINITLPKKVTRIRNAFEITIVKSVDYHFSDITIPIRAEKGLNAITNPKSERMFIVNIPNRKREKFPYEIEFLSIRKGIL